MAQSHALNALWPRLIAWLGLLVSATPVCAASPVVLSGRAMGTTWIVKLDTTAASLNQAQLTGRIGERLEQLEQQFSTYRSQSEISRFNASRSAADWIDVSPDFAAVAVSSLSLSAQTDGAFDVTVAPLVRLWGFAGERRAMLPTDAEIATARAHVGWRKLEARLNPPALRKHDPALTIDFSSMAKGFAADQVSELLAQLGLRAHLVQIGGDIKAGDGDWRLAIEPAADRIVEPAAIVRLAGHALSTSGDYRNFFTVGGRHFGHIIDPRTGRPVTGSLAAVSVVDRSCARSSARATALFVLGLEQGMAFATEHRLACLFQIRTGATLTQRMTPEFAALLVAAAAETPP